MKGSYRRFITRHTAKTYGRTMDLYERALDQLVKVSGDALVLDSVGAPSFASSAQ